MNNALREASVVAASGIVAARRRQQAASFAFGVATIRLGSALAANDSTVTLTKEFRLAEHVARQAYLTPQMPVKTQSPDPVAMGSIDIFVDVRVQVQNSIFVNVWDLIVVSIFNSDVAAEAAEAAADAAEAAEEAEAAEAAEAADVAAADVAAADVVDVVDLLVL